jgi:hypothetical protein
MATLVPGSRSEPVQVLVAVTLLVDSLGTLLGVASNQGVWYGPAI